MQKLDNFRKKNDGAISNGMKKILPYIFFIAICVNIFTPFSAIQSTPLVAEAALDTTLAGYQNAFNKIKSGVTLNQSAVTSAGGIIADFHIVLDTGLALGANTEDIYNHVEAQGRNFGIGDTGTNLYSTNAFVLVVKDALTGQVGFVDVTPRLMIDGSNKSLADKRPNGPVRSETDVSISTSQFPQLTPGKDYTATLYYQAAGGIGSGEGKGYGESIPGLSSNKDYFAITSPTPFKTATPTSGGGTGVEGTLGTGKSTVVDSQASLDPMPGCSILGMGDENGSIVGCAAQIIYYVIFVPTSYLFALAGQFFDWTFAYSISDESYRIPFVVQGWGILRDFVNMFFIFVLLYIAFRTILGVHGAKTKDLIINVIIIGLLINFSLFTTQVIVDASNILARVFYSDDAIRLTEGQNRGALDAAGTTAGPNGEIQLSAALIDKVNPQNLILNSKKVNDFGTTGNDVAQNNNEDSANSIGAGSFILITILAIAINIVGLITFLSVGLIFVARVIGLWFAMIFAPIAFFSYTVPSLANNKIFGIHHWIEELLKMAFLAPIFIFFLYLILQFLEGLNFINQGDQTGVKWVIAIVVPFIFIMVLLQQAKSIAQKLSGELGQRITGALSTVGGVGLGLATGGAALAMRGSVGRIMNKLNTNDTLNNWASGKTASGKAMSGGLGSWALQRAAILGKKTTTAGAKGSFDFRQTGLAGGMSGALGVDMGKYTNYVGLGTKSGLGGYANAQAKKIEKEETFAKSLGYDHAKDHALQEKIDARKKAITDAEKIRDMAKATLTADPNNAESKKSYATALANVTALKSGGMYVNDAGIKLNIKESLADFEKAQATNKTGREREFYLYKRRQSGKIYNESHGLKRDSEDNITSFGHPVSSGAQAGKQFAKEFVEGFGKGAVAGGAVGMWAGPAGAVAGAGAGGLFMAVRNVVNYSGTTNRKIGEAHNPKPGKFEDSYKPGSAPAPSGGHDDHGAGHDDHGGGHDDHGGGGHH